MRILFSYLVSLCVIYCFPIGLNQQNNSIALAESKPTSVPEQKVLRIEIPDAVSGQIQKNKMVQAAYLDILARLSQKPRLSLVGLSRLEYDEWGEPEYRFETFGNREYGLEMKATPIASGIGIHGEHGYWQFFGLPNQVQITGLHSLDLRGGTGNFLEISFQGVTAEQETQIRRWFAYEILALTSYDHAH
jgi:hypothetical protein